MAEETKRLTQLSHGGGCGCKIAPAVLQKILAGSTGGIIPPQLLVGTETSDDAAVYQINTQQAIVATTDFFMPIVDDPFDFGRIAATNAISDVYAMGGTPLFALALVGMPINVLPLETIGKILAGGESVCRAAGIPIAGGHTIDSVEPIYGLVAIGLVNPTHLRRNSEAKAGDKLMIDFAGKKLHLTDPLTDELTEVEFFIGILPASGYTYAKACYSQQLPEFLGALGDCLTFLGGVPTGIVTDNLKPAVNKASKYDPELNKTMADFAEHYNVCILPTRARSPKDKSPVEGMVKLLYTRVYAPINERAY